MASVLTMVLGDGQQMKTEISLSNPTRIIFEDDKPTKLIFNEADETAPTIAAVLGNSNDVFISVERGMVGQKISGFLTTESGKTYPIEFNIARIDSQQVTVASAELREKAKEAKIVSAQTPEAPLKKVEWSHGSSYTASMGNLIKALYWHQTPEGFVERRASKAPTFGTDEFTAVPYKSFVSENIEAIIYIAKPTKGYPVYLPNYMDEAPRYMVMSYSSEQLEVDKNNMIYLVRKRKAK